MLTDTTNPKISRMHVYGLATASLCFVLFAAAAISGRAELPFDLRFTSLNWLALLVPIALFICFVVGSIAIRKFEIKLRDSINLDTTITLSQDGLFCHSRDLMIPWKLVQEVNLDRRRHRKYEVTADLHLRLSQPILGQTVYTFDVARLCVPSQRVFEMVSYRVDMNTRRFSTADRGKKNAATGKATAST